MGRQSLPATRNKKTVWKNTIPHLLIKDIKEYTFVSALKIKSAKNKTFIDIWVFFHYNDHLVISYVAGAVAAGVDTDVGSLLKVQETGQSQGAATVTVADDGGLGLLEDVGETSTLQYIASKD